MRTRELDIKVWDRLTWLDNLTAEDLDAIAIAMSNMGQVPARDLEAEIANLDAQLAKLNRQWLATDMTEIEYNGLRSNITAQRAEIQKESAGVQHGRSRYSFATARAEMQEPVTTMQQKTRLEPHAANAAMRSLIERVVVRGHEIVEIVYKMNLEGVVT